ncbi:MAG: hypothetical protein IT451_01460 [Candidatus Brocadia sp.]|nr:hypothetical protein [Candidatus Brocadia sp.]
MLRIVVHRWHLLVVPRWRGIKGVDWQNQEFRWAHNLNIYKHFVNHGVLAMVGESTPG